MSIMTKKEIKAIEHLEINKCKLVAYEDFLALKEAFEEAVKTIKSIDLECGNENHDSYQMEHTIRDIVFEFLFKYEKEDSNGQSPR